MKARSIFTKQPEAVENADLLAWQNRRLTDVSEPASLQSWLPIECRQLSAGDYAGRYQELAIGGNLVVRENQNRVVQKSGVMAPGVCTLSFRRGAGLPLRFSEFDANSSLQLFLLPASTGFDVQVPAGLETVYVRFDQQQLFDAARAFDEARWSRAPDQLTPFLGPVCGQLDVFFGELFRMASGPDPWLPPDPDYLARITLDNVLLALDQTTNFLAGDAPDYRSRRRTLRLVTGTRDYIDDRLNQGHCPSVAELCAHVGASQRVLEYAFRKLLQIPPVTYLRVVRLNRVRTDLRTPTDPSLTVTEAATRWGFLHLGRFAVDYRRMFGESPSQTLLAATA